jgi:hypothetical protein
MHRHRPTDDPSAEDIQDDGEIEEAGTARHVSDVGDPEPVHRLRREVALYQIRRRSRLTLTKCPSLPLGLSLDRAGSLVRLRMPATTLSTLTILNSAE